MKKQVNFYDCHTSNVCTAIMQAYEVNYTLLHCETLDYFAKESTDSNRVLTQILYATKKMS